MKRYAGEALKIMTEFIHALFNPQFPLIRFALLAGLIASIPFGIIGSFVIVRRMSYIAGSISHASLAGIGAALFINETFKPLFVSPLLGALASAVIFGLIIALVSIVGKERQDTVIGTIWAVGMGTGLLFLSLTPGYVDPMSYIFGNILLIGMNELMLIVILSLLIIGLGILFYNPFHAISFDEEFARTRGINTSLYQILLIMLTSCTVVLMVSVVGIVMVIALLTIPPAIAGLISKKLWQMMLFSILFCMLITASGLVLSYTFRVLISLTTIVLPGVIYLILVLVFALIKALRSSTKY
jgi:zinc transport system permease protein